MTFAGPFDRSTPIGLVGPGVMGRGIASNLLRKGFALHVFARRPDAAAPLRAEGARIAARLADLGACRVVLLSLPDAQVVDDVLFGAGGLADALQPGSVVVDTSTIAPVSARRIGDRLRERGLWLLDAPVSGGQKGAEAGTLGCMVGGPAVVLDACRGVLEAFCKAITHVGGQGAGQAVKACNQVAVSAALLGVADAITLALKEGVDPALMRQVLLGGTARSFSLEQHGERIVARNFVPGFRAQLMRKDLRLALDSARLHGASLPSSQLAERLLDQLCESGRADWDCSAVALVGQEASGLPVPPAGPPPD